MTDKEYIFNLIEEEKQRQENEICLIASENYMSEDVIKACGSVFINKYSEGYSGHRYYGGCSVVDKLEDKCNELARKLFNCKWSNVQPHSGTHANQCVYKALLQPNDTILAMDINSGSHISHSLKSGFAGTFYNVVTYGLDENGFLNYDEIKEKLYEHHPRLLIVGASAYPRIIDFERIRKIVDEYNQGIADYYNQASFDDEDSFYGLPDKYYDEKCYMMVDMAHTSGLSARFDKNKTSVCYCPSPLPYADVVTSTVQKTLRSGRGGIILSNDEELGKKIDKAVFPQMSGGPLMNMIAGKAMGFAEALEPDFLWYQDKIIQNIHEMLEVFKANNIKMITNGSSNHLILIDLKGENFSGKDLEEVLEKQGIITNKNAVQGDTRPKTETSGLRIGTACITTRGMGRKEANIIANIIASNIQLLRTYNGIPDEVFEKNREIVKNLCKQFPIYK